MTFTDSIRQGFEGANKNWPLIVIYLVFVIAAFIGLAALVILFILFGAGIFGADLQSLGKNFDLDRLQELLRPGYLVPLALSAIVFLLYLLAAMTVGIFVYGASCSLLVEGVKEKEYRFSLGRFYEEGKFIFLPFIGYSTLVGLVVIVEAAIGILAVLAMSAVHEALKGANESLATFLLVLGILVVGVAAFFILAGTFSVSTYGIGILCLKRSGVFEAFGQAASFHVRKPAAFWFYCLNVIGILGATMLIAIVGAVVTSLPFIGVILVIPYQIAVQAAQGYIGFFFLSNLFAYYLGNRTISAGSGAGFLIDNDEKPVNGEKSTGMIDSGPRGDGQAPPLDGSPDRE